MIGSQLQHFANVLTLVQMKESRRLEAFEADRPDFGGAVMIDHARSPLLFNSLSCRWNAPARFAGNDNDPHAALGERPAAVLGGDLGETQRVSRRAADHSG